MALGLPAAAVRGHPLGLIVHQAGGLASTGTERILDIVLTELHQKVLLIIGRRKDVEAYESFMKK